MSNTIFFVFLFLLLFSAVLRDSFSGEKITSENIKEFSLKMESSLKPSTWILEDETGKWARKVSAGLEPDIYNSARTVYVSALPGTLAPLKISEGSSSISKVPLNLSTVPVLKASWAGSVFKGTATNGFFITTNVRQKP